MSNIVRENATAAQASQDQRVVTVGPRVDVLETESEFRVFADMPGVKPDDVDIRFEKGELTVIGRRLSARENATTNYFRTFAVADAVAADRITAELKVGVLTTHLPKTEAVKPKRIAVTG